MICSTVRRAYIDEPISLKCLARTAEKLALEYHVFSTSMTTSVLCREGALIQRICRGTAIGDADCYGGWEKLLRYSVFGGSDSLISDTDSTYCLSGNAGCRSDVGYAGISDSGEVHFDRAGDYTRIAAVRKSGYVSCDCNGRTEALCGGHPSCRAGTIEPCCDNPDGHWDLCACN